MRLVLRRRKQGGNTVRSHLMQSDKCHVSRSRLGRIGRYFRELRYRWNRKGAERFKCVRALELEWCVTGPGPFWFETVGESTHAPGKLSAVARLIGLYPAQQKWKRVGADVAYGFLWFRSFGRSRPKRPIVMNPIIKGAAFVPRSRLLEASPESKSECYENSADY
jgi:hypothetical protein